MSMDINEQEKTYDGFMKGTKWGILSTLGILVILLAVYIA